MKQARRKKRLHKTAFIADTWSILLFTFFTLPVFGAEISYPKEELRNDPLEEGRSLYPVSHGVVLASGNKVSVDYLPRDNMENPDSVFAGFARAGTSEKNRLSFNNGHVGRFVFGGFSLQGDAGNNLVVFSGGIVADAAIGKLCGGQTKDGDVKNNVVRISGGLVGGDVYGGDADADGHADGNRVEITGGRLSGFVNGGGVSGIGIARKNRVRISGGTVGMGVAGGFAHFAVGTPFEPAGGMNGKNREKTNSALENSVEISGNAEIEGNVSGGFVLDSDGSADNNSLEISGGTIRGNVYGGRAFRGEANGNTVVISGGTIEAHDAVVYAGHVHQPEKGRATGNTVSLSGSPNLATVTLHGNNFSTWKTDGNILYFRNFKGTIHGLSHFQDVHIDKDSCVRVVGEGPHELHDLTNEGRMILENGRLMIHGKASGNGVERSRRP